MTSYEHDLIDQIQILTEENTQLQAKIEELQEQKEALEWDNMMKLSWDKLLYALRDEILVTFEVTDELHDRWKRIINEISKKVNSQLSLSVTFPRQNEPFTVPSPTPITPIKQPW